MNLLWLELLFSLGAVYAEEVDSKKLPILIQERNSKVIATQMQANAASNREGYLLRSYLPEINLTAAQEQYRKGRESTKNEPLYGAEAKINLYNGGRDSLESRKRQIESEKFKFKSVRILSEELERARTLYWNILFERDRLKLIDEAVRLNDETLKSAIRRIQSGVATESDKAEFEMKSVELKQEKSSARLRYEKHVRELALLLGLENQKMTFSEVMDHEHDYEKLLDHKPEDHNALLKEAELTALSLYTESKKQKRAWWPQLDAFASYNQFNQREEEKVKAEDRTETVLGLRLSMSLSSGFESGYEAGALEQEAAAAKVLAEYERRELELHLQNEMDELKLMHDQVHEAEDNILRAEKYFKLTQSEYGRGVKNSPDVLGAIEKLFTIKLKRLEIVRDFQVAKAHVLAKIGK